MTTSALIEKITRLIDCGAYNDALAKIEILVDKVFCEPLNVGKVFGSPDLDRFCQAIGAACLARLQEANGRLPRSRASKVEDSKIAVYIVSKLQPSGGHTAALADFIRLSPASRSVVIVTGTCGSTNRKAVQQKFQDLSDVGLEYVPSGNHLGKLEWLQQRLAELSPETVWLFNHHQDSVAVAAVQPGQGYRLRFYHHGDHHLCLGVHLGYAEHIDPHPMGYHNCRENLKIHDNQYLPLVAVDYGNRQEGLEFLGQKGLVTCTAGGFNKLEVPYFIQYTEVVPQLLKMTGGRHIHLGRLTPLALWQIRRTLRKSGIDPRSFVYIPYVPSVWRALHEFAVDVYVASFPYGGGRTLVEVMGAGVPAVIHSNYTSRMLGGFDMAYLGVFIWRQPQELFAHLQQADGAQLAREGRLARSWYEKYHREEVLRGALEHTSRIEVPSLRVDYQPDALMSALQNCQEMTLRGLLYRTFLCQYRRLQGRWGRTMG